MSPNAVFTTAPAATDTKLASSEMRVPTTMRLKMSRPRESTPNQCSRRPLVHAVVVKIVFSVVRDARGAEDMAPTRGTAAKSARV